MKSARSCREFFGCSVRRVLASAPLFFVFLIAAPAADLSEEVTISAWYGFDRYGRLGCWTPVTVEVGFAPRSGREMLDADVRIVKPHGAAARDALVISRGVRLGPGAKRLTLCLVPQYGASTWSEARAQGTAVEIFDRSRGQVVAAASLPEADDLSLQIEADFFIVIFGGDRLGLRALLRQLGAKARADQHAFFPPKMVAAKLPPDLAPDCAAAYEGVDAIVWEDPQPAALRPGQREALMHWARAGGRLVLTFSAQSAAANLDSLADLLPGRIAGRVELSLRDRAAGGCELPDDIAQACAGMWEADENLRKKTAAALAAAGQRSFPLLVIQPTRGRVLLLSLIHI